MKEILLSFLQKKKKEAVALFSLVAIVVIVILVIVLYQVIKPEPKKPDPEIQISIERAIKKNHLNTIEYPVIRAISVSEKGEDVIKYHVSYEGKIILGVDMEKISVKVEDAKDKKEKSKIIITIPDAKVLSPVVKEDSLDYIFAKNKYETETVYEEAFRACKEDLQSYAKNNKEQLQLAKERAIRDMKALLLPFEESLEKDYIFEIK